MTRMARCYRQGTRLFSQKGVYEVRKIPHGVKAIPTKLVLRIKLKSDGTVEKYKVRCVALGFLQRAGLHYHPDECYLLSHEHPQHHPHSHCA